MTLRAAADARHGKHDGGFTFIEVLVAVTLLAIAVVGILPAVWANVRGSGLQDQFGKARTWVVAAGEYATSPDFSWVSCTSATIATSYVTALRTGTAASQPAGWPATRLEVTAVKYWNGTTFVDCAGAVPATVTALENAGLRMQLVSLRVTSPDGRAKETLEVAKP